LAEGMPAGRFPRAIVLGERLPRVPLRSTRGFTPSSLPGIPNRQGRCKTSELTVANRPVTAGVRRSQRHVYHNYGFVAL